MTDRELMQMALDALITAELDGNCEYGATDALRTRLSQCERCGEANPAEIHTCTPQREWQDLTDEECDEIWDECLGVFDCLKMTEAKLKEKNG
jgi:hypothetical protein